MGISTFTSKEFNFLQVSNIGNSYHHKKGIQYIFNVDNPVIWSGDNNNMGLFSDVCWIQRVQL